MLTQKRLKELLSYNRKTGKFTWKVKHGSCMPGDQVVDNSIHNRGYIVISIDGKRYPANRLAWLYCYGEMPKSNIGHINHDRSDNRMINLRETVPSESSRNTRIHRSNKSGANGVSWDKFNKKWKVQIMMRGKSKTVGRCKNFEDAVLMRKVANARYGFHINHGVW